MARQCPKCAGPMTLVKLGKVVVDVCTVCGGTWFDAGELSRALGQRADENRGLPTLQGRASDRLCPLCAVPLYEREMARSGALVEECPLCRGLYLDRAEFDAVARYYAARCKDKGQADDGISQMEQAIAQAVGKLPARRRFFCEPLSFATLVLSTLMVVVTVFMLRFGSAVLTRRLGFIPGDILEPRSMYRLFTAFLPTTNLTGLLTPLAFLLVGDRVELRMGWRRHLLLIAACALSACATTAYFQPDRLYPVCGGEPLVAGLLCAVLVVLCDLKKAQDFRIPPDERKAYWDGIALLAGGSWLYVSLPFVWLEGASWEPRALLAAAAVGLAGGILWRIADDHRAGTVPG